MTQHQSLFCPFWRHQRWAGEPGAHPHLLEATVPFSLCLCQRLICCECVRVRGAFCTGPVGGTGLSVRGRSVPLALQGQTCICRTLIPLNKYEEGVRADCLKAALCALFGVMGGLTRSSRRSPLRPGCRSVQENAREAACGAADGASVPACPRHCLSLRSTPRCLEER